MNLQYGFKMSLLSEEDGGGFLIEVPDLPGCMTDGDTPEEAFSKLNDAIESWIDAARELGRPIPEPKEYSRSDEYSGKLTLRMPKQLHKDLAIASDEQGVSINQSGMEEGYCRFASDSTLADIFAKDEEIY